MIGNISNGEQGISVRDKLNEVIDLVNRLGAGTYTPVLSGFVNCSSVTVNDAFFQRGTDGVNDIVTVYFNLVLLPSSGSVNCNVDVSLPVGATFSMGSDCIGHFSSVAPVNLFTSGDVFADTSNNLATLQWFSSNTNNHTLKGSFSYKV